MPQHKIGSGFGFHSTADDVLAGIDLSGKLAIVTGGYSGIGVPTTRALTRAGAHVVVPARRPELARQNVDAEVAPLDLGDLDSVREFADRFLATGRRVDLMINSAAVMANPETRVGPGWESQFAVNHLGHFALVNRLRPALADDVRVVSVSSAGHQHSDIRRDDLHFARGYDRSVAYGQSKAANVLFAVRLNKLGLQAFALGWIDERGTLVDPTFESPEQGAATQVWAATSPRLAGLGGLYCEDVDVAEPNNTEEKGWGVRDSAARLWALSEELTSVHS